MLVSLMGRPLAFYVCRNNFLANILLMGDETMLVVQVCVGSACHLKGSPEIVELLQNAVTEHHLEDDVILCGSFCIGKCNRVGVTIQVDDDIHVGITRENFRDFFTNHILKAVKGV